MLLYLHASVAAEVRAMVRSTRILNNPPNHVGTAIQIFLFKQFHLVQNLDRLTDIGLALKESAGQM